MSLEDMKAQKLADQMALNNNPAPSATLAGGQPTCPQCGIMHPPVSRGSTCPNAPVKNEQGDEMDLTKFFIQLKNICMSQIEVKKIKDLNKLFNGILIEITKFLEEYKE